MTNRKTGSDVREAILMGAQLCFFRYGFARTRVMDVAKEAKVSRATLYNHFASKDELFRGLASHLMGMASAEAEAALQGDGDLWARLEVAFDCWFARPMEVLAGEPHTDELMQAGHELVVDILADLLRKLTATVQGQIELAESAGDISLAAVGVSAADLADAVVTAGYGFKQAHDPDLFRKRMRSLLAVHRVAFAP